MIRPPKLKIEHIEASCRARKAVGASKVRLILLKQAKIHWICEFHVIPMEHCANTFRKDGTFAAFLRRPIEKALEEGVDDFNVTSI